VLRLRKALSVIARQQGRGLCVAAEEAGSALVAGLSVKAVLDLDWDDPRAQQHALTRILDDLSAVEHWLDPHLAAAAVAPQVVASLAVAEQVRTQDITVAPNGTPALCQGVAAERRIRVEEAEMCHGRKSRSLLVDGDKRQADDQGWAWPGATAWHPGRSTPASADHLHPSGALPAPTLGPRQWCAPAPWLEASWCEGCARAPR
jgi:hypothetical protein